MPEFIFKTELWTAAYTGIKANTLATFTKALREVDDDTIYYHLYRNMFEYHFLPTDFGNSFAYWLAENGFPALAEKFSSIDLMECVCIKDVRSEMLKILESYGGDGGRVCKPFYFIRAVRKVLDVGVRAGSVEELAAGIGKVSINSLFYHLITSRLVHGEPTNDFSRWLRSVGEEEKAKAIDGLELMAHSLYDIREMILDILER
ncbi:MAG TPA: hypothetical protein EYP11_01990 [Aquificaceae bacterium]|nr:hypothetical protein [Aquificaceae bacterium]